ncbi:3-isopropylmalate dehydrogenase [soil metagenome]
MKKHIAVLPGDGVGPEVAAEAVKVLKKIAKKYNHEFTFEEALIGGAAIDKVGDPFLKETEELCLKADAILFGAIGDPKFDNDPTAKIRPEQGLLRMRKTLGLYANVRPIMTFEATIDQSPLKREIIEGADFIVIRELIGGIYFGEKGRQENGTKAYDISTYTIQEIERVGVFAFELAQKRRKHLTLVDKANVLETSRLWRETVQKMSKNYPDVEVEYMFVDNAAMQIIKRPTTFDVILTENMFGDILTDEASVITGSIGMLPSASIGAKTSVYEPIHGSYPKAAGQNTANPIGTILSAAMLLEYSFGMVEEGKAIREAVNKTLESKIGTKDIYKISFSSTQRVGDIVTSFL